MKFWPSSPTVAKYHLFQHVIYSWVSYTLLNGNLNERNFVQAEGNLLKLGSFYATSGIECSGVICVVTSERLMDWEHFCCATHACYPLDVTTSLNEVQVFGCVLK